jgi:DNA polymerase III subunit epsilon
MDHVAIDFETANEQRASACSLGIVVVRSGKIVEKKYWLVRPRELYFNPYNVGIHGISPEDVKDEPEFCDLWDSIRPLMEGQRVIAHNASFDMSVLRNTLTEYRIPFPDLNYLCTRIVSKETWRGLPTYNLSYLADMLGIQFEHHNALEDALACSEIVRLASEHLHVRSLDGLVEALAIAFGELSPHGYTPPRNRSARRHYDSVRIGDLVPNTQDFDPEHPLFGCTIVFTGTLNSMHRREAMQAVVDVGGACGSSVTKTTDYLVLGDFDFRQFKGGEKSSKLRKAETLIADGQRLEIVPEKDFLRMLYG